MKVKEMKPTQKKIMYSILVWMLTIWCSANVFGDTSNNTSPWEKLNISAGVFLSSLDSSFRIGSGVGLDIDVENLLDLDSTNTIFRTDISWRFTDNRKHRMDFKWFSFKRDGDRITTEDILIGDGEDQILIPEGTGIKGYFDLDIYQIAYTYSFLQDERIDIAAGGGFYIMPIKFGLNVVGEPEEGGSADFTAPLPVLGFRMDIALTPKWFVRSGSQIFYIEYDKFKGSLIEIRGAVEYNPWEHVGFGLGFDTFNLNIHADGEDWPGIDLDGEIEMRYNGLQLYFRYFI